METMIRKESAVDKYAVSIIYSIVLIAVTAVTYFFYQGHLSDISSTVKFIFYVLLLVVSLRIIIFKERWNWVGMILAIIGIVSAVLVLSNANY